LADGLAGVGEEITLFASNILGPTAKIVGGTAADDMKFLKTFVFSNDKIASDAVSICLLASKMPLFTGIKHGHIPLSRPLKITKARENVLYEIDNQPAWEVWKKETAQSAKKIGIDVEKLTTPTEIAQFTSNYELGLPAEKEGEYKVRWPLSKNDDGSLNFSCGIAEGAIFCIMDGSKQDDLIFAAEEAARIARQSAENSGYKELAGVFIFECSVRQMMLGEKFHKGVNRYKKMLRGVPILGWETYGEICMDPGQFSGFHNTTSVVLVIPTT
jgi:methyl-accepting chemotaxis protein